MIMYLVALPLGLHDLQGFMKEVQWWKFDSAGKEVEKRIKKESNIIAIVMIIDTFLVTITTIAFTVPQNVDRHLLYEVALIEDLFPTWSNVLKIVHRIQAFFVRPFCVLTSFSLFLYIFCNTRFQMYMILNYIKTINEGCENDQVRIKDRLVFCFKSYIQLSEAVRRMLKVIESSSLAYQAMTLVVIVSTATYVLLFQDYAREQNFRFVCLSSCGVFMLVTLFQLGQSTEDSVTEVYETLMTIDWYDWNESTKKIYLMFLLSTVKPLRIQFSENYSLNYNMAVQVVQNAASVVLVVYQLNFM
ncbi:uncharacterized protein LOC135125354 [Zophobas morio]|uniref:uncharacterized protein LOC135125354 n=1 Tax=Zophobas morio TaxID=2755281 RepID=UPI003083667B